MATSAEALATALDEIDGLVKELNRLHAYASMRSDSDARVAACHAMRQEVVLLWNELSKSTAWVRPEILEIDPGRLREFLRTADVLAPHHHMLENLLRQRAHVLGPPEERILAEAGLVTGGAHSLYNVLHNAELPRPEIRLSDGERFQVTPAAFARHRATPVRSDREALFGKYFEAYDAFRQTLGANLYEAVKAHMFRARSRDYGSCLEAALDADNIPTSVYTNLVEQVGARLGVMHRYFRLRARALGIERAEYHDLHCPLVRERGRRYSVEDAAVTVRRAMRPLGDTYAKALDEAFRGRWIDWRPTEGKRSGAYATGAAYDVHPYILMNFNEDYESVSTLAHEIGHAMHSLFSNRTQPYATAEYSIFVAEVASTFNEALLNARLEEEAESDEERLMLLGTWLDQMRATLFRQTMFAEFEWRIHERAEAGEALTGDLLSEMYLELLRRYHGHDDGVMPIPDRYAIEWAAVPHFYYDFYVYQYSTGIVAATALAQSVLEDRSDARDRYLRFLGTGGSDYPLDLLRRAGVDLESPEPYERTYRAIESRLDRLEELLDRLDRS